MNIEECLKEGYLKRIKPSKDLVEKEFKEAEYDLGKAKSSIHEEDFKWAVIKAYYSIFHSARAAVFSLGYRESKHFAIQVVLEELSKKGQIDSEYVDYFSAAMEARENADYRYTYSKETAEDIIEYAEKFLEEIKGFCRRIRV